jgi:hypothetical protein
VNQNNASVTLWRRRCVEKFTLDIFCSIKKRKFTVKEVDKFATQRRKILCLFRVWPVCSLILSFFLLLFFSRHTGERKKKPEPISVPSFSLFFSIVHHSSGFRMPWRLFFISFHCVQLHACVHADNKVSRSSFFFWGRLSSKKKK